MPSCDSVAQFDLSKLFDGATSPTLCTQKSSECDHAQDCTNRNVIITSEKEDGPLFKFYEVILDVGGDFMNKITTMRDLTLFAPSNEAWADSNLNNLIRNKEKLREILNLHLVQERLPIDKIKENNMNQQEEDATYWQTSLDSNDQGLFQQEEDATYWQTALIAMT
uniref:FAS1 domain-containing protein n=1 Tax=Timema tahoe TaxID=61484 RepID=A0A7R9IK53_9NEOP|nr:unnamed protein product [Timema tahoe]